jgi:hypothetical protein
MTLSMGVLVVSLGIIYSQIFQTDIKTYLPYLALGFIVAARNSFRSHIDRRYENCGPRWGASNKACSAVGSPHV